MRQTSLARVFFWGFVSLVIHSAAVLLLGRPPFSPAVMPSGTHAVLLGRFQGEPPAERPGRLLGFNDNERRTMPSAGEGAQIAETSSAAPAEGVYYWPAAMVERLALPVSAPDVSRLNSATLPADSVRLRLFISARGQVEEVSVLGGADEEVWAPLREMFFATAFIPARRGGMDVASVQDLEVNISDLVRVL